jgi:hypothetical protein
MASGRFAPGGCDWQLGGNWPRWLNFEQCPIRLPRERVLGFPATAFASRLVVLRFLGCVGESLLEQKLYLLIQ